MIPLLLSPVLRTSDLDYHLPEELIATQPATPREAARLMVVSRRTGDILEHAHVRDLPRFLHKDDLLVLNHTRVLPARFEGWRVDTNGQVEGLYLQPGQTYGQTLGKTWGKSSGAVPTNDEPASRTWVALLSGRRMRESVLVGLLDRCGQDSGYRLRLLHKFEGDGGAWLVEVFNERAASLPSDIDLLDLVGLTPLPPYIRAARKRNAIASDDTVDRERYQTVYAKHVAPPAHTVAVSPHAEVGVPTTGSIAAPTAGLHLTTELLASLTLMGVRCAEVALHVGLGTFRPVETEYVEQHRMHHERCAIDPTVLDQIRHLSTANSSTNAGRVICVGTTSARALETYANAVAQSPSGPIPPWVDTNILITPGYRWQWTQGLLTNFHLPRSTLLAMIASLFEPAGNEGTDTSRSDGLARVRRIYDHAIAERYRFYSYGDAMLILP